MVVALLCRIPPGQEVFQRPGLVLFLTDDSVSLLLLHLPDSGGEGVNVVKHRLHGDGDLIGLLLKKKNKRQT